MIERSWSLPMRWFAITKKIKVLWVRCKSRKILLEIERIECLVQNKVTDDVPIVADAP